MKNSLKWYLVLNALCLKLVLCDIEYINLGLNANLFDGDYDEDDNQNLQFADSSEYLLSYFILDYFVIFEL